MPQTINGTLGKVSERIADAVGGTLGAARHTVHQAEHAAGELIYDASRNIRRHPLRVVMTSIGVAFAAGMLLGRVGRRRR